MVSPFVVVIFGATGDLARHKLFPALYSMFKKKWVGEKFYIVGFARRPLSDEQYREYLREELKMSKEELESKEWREFEGQVFYQQSLFDDIKGYVELNKRLNEFDKQVGACVTRLFYLATPPDKYMGILNNLEESKLSEGCGQGSEKWTRLAIEKPFGKDIETARELDKRLSEIFEEKQIYRVDHYLGKETLQNMIAFRFANGIFEPVWNKKYIDHVQITFAEEKGVEGRGTFFDDVGIVRDVAQNHLVQLLATVAMEQPRSFSHEAVRDARAEAIAKLKLDGAEDFVRGQYEGYRSEPGVGEGSVTETFAAMKLFVDTDRFAGVPFYIRTGKMMPRSVVEIKLVFIQTCHMLFKEFGCPEVGNVLTIRVQPDEGIRMRIVAKTPEYEFVDAPTDSVGPHGERLHKLALMTAEMKFSYKDQFGDHMDSAYETLLNDIFMGDQMLFNRSDELDSSWKFITHVMNLWNRENKKEGFEIATYNKGSWGPDEASDLIERDGRKWIE